MNADPRVRLAVLGLLNTAGKWARLQIYMHATMDADMQVAERAVSLLFAWVQNFNRSFSVPTDDDLVVIRTLFDKARDRLPLALERGVDFVLRASLS